VLAGTLLLGVPHPGPGHRAAAAEDGKTRAKPKPATRRVQGVRPWAYKRLERAHAALADGNYPACRAALDELQDDRERLNDHERALTWQTYGYVQASQEQYAEAAASFEHSLEGDGLPEAAQQDVRYNLAQLYVILKRYDDAIETFRVWFEAVEDPPASAHYLLAMTYVQKDEHATALPQARLAVAKAEEPKESWLQLLLSLLIRQEQFTEALPVASRLVARFPKKTYWLQLSGLHSRLGQHREALGALEAAYEQGLLTSREEIVRLAQLYLFNQVPYRGAEVLDEALREERIPGDAETWELLANAWLQARERKRARPALEQAARLSGAGEIWMRLAQVQLDQEQWAEARESLAAALRKGGLKNPGQAQLLLGVASASEERWQEARAAFAAAQRHDATRQVATQWLASVDSELEMRAEEEKVAEAPTANAGDTATGGNADTEEVTE
jgi:hypothetical protein